MHEHLVHYLFTALPFLLILLLLLKRSIRFSAFQIVTLSVIILFLVLHTAPISIVFASHHQATAPGEHHPCCMHQVSEPATQFVFVPQFKLHEITEIISPQIYAAPFISYHTSRSPPEVA